MITFNLPCKDYTKHFLETNFGAPALIRHEGVIGQRFFHLVEDASERREKEVSLNYKHMVEIRITQDMFLRKGCVLTKTNILAFNRFVEDYFKNQIHIFLDSLIEFSDIEISKAIECVYDKFDMDESIMTHECIRKDYQRYRLRRNAA